MKPYVGSIVMLEQEILVLTSMLEELENYKESLQRCVEIAVKRGLTLWSVEDAEREIKRLRGVISQRQVEWDRSFTAHNSIIGTLGE